MNGAVLPQFSLLQKVPLSDDPAALADLAGRLRALGYCYDGIQDLLGQDFLSRLAPEHMAAGRWASRRISQSSQASREQKNLALTIGFFILGLSYTATELDEALGAGASQLLAHLKLSQPSQGENREPAYRSSIDLRPYASDRGGQFWIGSDLGAQQSSGVLAKDYVLGISQASLTLAQYIERSPVATALDLGCGCGIQIFHLLDHVKTVTATDISERALAFTRFNLLLNADQLKLDPQNLAERVILKQGSLLEPVAGQSFDLIVSNPPFVITPRQSQEKIQDRYVYRDAGMVGDELLATLVGQLPQHLKAGGRAQLLGNWEIYSSEQQGSWSDRLEGWLCPSTEAWVIQRQQVSTQDYAQTWLQDSSQQKDPAGFEAAFAAYLDDFTQRQVGAIGFGLLWLRRQALPDRGRLLRRFEEITHPLEQPLAPAITAQLAAYDRLNRLTDQELSQCHLLVAADVSEERHALPGAADPAIILLRQGSGLRRVLQVGTQTAGFVAACDGQLSVGQICGALKALLEQQGQEFDQADLLHHIRQLIEEGFLLFATETLD